MGIYDNYFNGQTKTMTIPDDMVIFDTKTMYSAWKEWVQNGDNAKYPQAFRTVGGDPTIGVNYISTYFFLMNGWKIKPPEKNCTIQVNGILLVDGGGDPFVSTDGTYNVRINMTTPMQAESIVVETGVSGLTPSESAKLDQLNDIIGLVSALQTLTPQEREQLFKLATKADVINAAFL